MVAAVAHDWTMMFIWLGVALIIDGIDGSFARAVDTAANAPRWSGDVLDLVVDFTTYVFVPTYAIVAADLMPPTLALAAGFVITVTAALYFADGNMKSADNHFVGFPAVWNLIAFYLLLTRPDAWITILIIALFAVLTFVPMKFVHPVRVRRLRWLNTAALLAWSVLALLALVEGLAPQPWVTAALCLIAVYFLLAGLVPSRLAAT
jgi:phosphatidylcholine synthase